MKKLSETLIELGIDFTFPIEIKDANGNKTYYEENDGLWWKCEYDANGNDIYYEDNDGLRVKREYDADGNQTYYENSYGKKRNQTHGQSCAGQVIEIDGKKYRLKEI